MSADIKFRAAVVNQTATYVSPLLTLTPGKTGLLVKFNVSAVPGVDQVQCGPQGMQINAVPGQEWFAFNGGAGDFYSALRATTGKDVIYLHPAATNVASASCGCPCTPQYRIVVIHTGAGAFNYEIEVEEVE